MATSNENRVVIDLSTVKYFGELLPRFNGNSNELQTFLVESENFMSQFGSTDNALINRYCFATIKSKLIDQAKTIVYSGPCCNTWPELKQLLNSKFGFKINFDVLQSEYQYMKKKSKETLSEFIDRVRNTKLQYDYQIQLLGLTPPEINVYRNLSDKIGNTVLYNNVDENSRNLLDLQPKPFDETCKLLENREIKRQQLYLQPITKPPFTQNSFQNFNTSRMHYNQTATTSREFPSQPIELKFNKVPETKFATASQVFGKPREVFKPHPNHKLNLPKPEPMSIRTRNYQVKRPASSQVRTEPPNNRQFFRKTGPPEYLSEELTNTENIDYPELEQEQDLEYSDEIVSEHENETVELEDENFQTLAFQNQTT